MLTYPVLLADIGGTYARFAVMPEAAADPTSIWKVATDGFSGPVAAIQAYLGQAGGLRPRSAFLGVAGRLGDGSTCLTNAAWVLDAREIGLAHRLHAMRIVNDYVPLAAALTVLDGDDAADLVRLGPAAGGTGTRLVLGPGTGLGAAALIPVEGRYLIQTTEAGHVGLGACAADDGMPWSGLLPTQGRITAETLLSGPGLVRIALALASSRGVTVGWQMPAEVLAARTASHPEATEAVRLFAHLLGRFAGDLALVFASTGGVFLAGGIAPRIIEDLQGPAFRSAFEDKPPFCDALHAIPRYVITRPEPAIDGLAALLRDGDRFLFPGQDWRGVEAHQGCAPMATAR